jgi:hypothetical protein
VPRGARHRRDFVYENSPWSAYEELQTAAFQPPIGAGIATERQDVNTLECESDEQDLPD